jgi:hypothetical protein
MANKKPTESSRDDRINKLMSQAEGTTDVKVHTTCRNCSKAFTNKNTADELVFGYHIEHPFIPGHWPGLNNN